MTRSLPLSTMPPSFPAAIQRFAGRHLVAVTCGRDDKRRHGAQGQLQCSRRPPGGGPGPPPSGGSASFFLQATSWVGTTGPSCLCGAPAGSASGCRCGCTMTRTASRAASGPSHSGQPTGAAPATRSGAAGEWGHEVGASPEVPPRRAPEGASLEFAGALRRHHTRFLQCTCLSFVPDSVVVQHQGSSEGHQRRHQRGQVDRGAVRHAGREPGGAAAPGLLAAGGCFLPWQSGEVRGQGGPHQSGLLPHDPVSSRGPGVLCCAALCCAALRCAVCCAVQVCGGGVRCAHVGALALEPGGSSPHLSCCQHLLDPVEPPPS